MKFFYLPVKPQIKKVFTQNHKLNRMKRTTIRLLFLVLISMWSTYAMAQDRRTVTGTVRDSAGTGIAGVSFVVKGTKTAGSTDANGNFNVTVSTNNPVLVFSSVGF